MINSVNEHLNFHLIYNGIAIHTVILQGIEKLELTYNNKVLHLLVLLGLDCVTPSRGVTKFGGHPSPPDLAHL